MQVQEDVKPEQTGGGKLHGAALIVGVSVVMGLVFDYLFFDKAFGVSFLLFALLTLGSVFVVKRNSGERKLSKSTYGLGALIVFFAAMVFVRAGGFITFVNVMTVIYLSLLLALSVWRPNLHTYRLKEFAAPFWDLPRRLLGKWAETMREFGGLGNKISRHKNLQQVLRGVAIAVPVLLVFLALFMSADDVFRKYATQLFSFDIDSGIFQQSIVIVLVATAFVGFLAYISKRPEESLEPTDDAKPSLVGKLLGQGMTETAILLGSLNALFALFIVVQLAYLFGGERMIAGEGFTYAQYARKGFFELIAVAVMTLGVTWFTERHSARKASQHPLLFKILSGALVVQTGVVLVSAFKRLALYESAYGFTSLRLYSHIAIVWLAIVFVILLVKIFKNARESSFMLAVFAVTVLFLAGVNVLNVDGFAAKKNIERFSKTGKLDTYHLAGLSDDAVPEMVRVLDKLGTDDKANFAYDLNMKRLRIEAENNDWQSYNLGRQRALDALNAKSKLLQKYSLTVSPEPQSQNSQPL